MRRSIFADIPWFILLIISGCLSLFLFFQDPTLGASAIFIPLVIAAALAHRYLDNKYLMGKDYSALVNGLLSLRQSTTRIIYDDMMSVEVTKSLYQRFLNIGDLRISTKLIDDPEVTFYGIHNPYFYRAIVERMMFISQENER